MTRSDSSSDDGSKTDGSSYNTMDMGIPYFITDPGKVSGKRFNSLPYFRKTDVVFTKENPTPEQNELWLLRNGTFMQKDKEVKKIHRILLRRSATCTLSHVASPHCIWVKLLNHITDQLLLPIPIEDEVIPLNKSEYGKFKYYMAPYNDTHLSRVRILHSEEDDSKRFYCYVLFIDFGHTKWVPWKVMRELPELFYFHPWQAIPVTLFPLYPFTDITEIPLDKNNKEDVLKRPMWSEAHCDLAEKILRRYATFKLYVSLGSHTCFNTSLAKNDFLEQIVPIIGELNGISEKDGTVEEISIGEEIVRESDDTIYMVMEYVDPKLFIFNDAILGSKQMEYEMTKNYLISNKETVDTVTLKPSRVSGTQWGDIEDVGDIEDFGLHQVAQMNIDYLTKHNYFLDNGEIVVKIDHCQLRCLPPSIRISLVKPVEKLQCRVAMQPPEEPEDKKEGNKTVEEPKEALEPKKTAMTKAEIVENHPEFFDYPTSALEAFSTQLQEFYGNKDQRLMLPNDQIDFEMQNKRKVFAVLHCIMIQEEPVPLHSRYRRVEIKKIEKMGKSERDSFSEGENIYSVTVEYIDYGIRETISYNVQLYKIHESFCRDPPFVNVMRFCFPENDFYDRKDAAQKELFWAALRRDKLYVAKPHDLASCHNGKPGLLIHLENLRVIDDPDEEPFENVFKRRIVVGKLEPKVQNKNVKIRSWHRLAAQRLAEESLRNGVQKM
ncbi:hypothetical protein L596_010031 [Steinernema carpocapsae]|uniref:Tudor domain-containing protein n=1 Tax=Steinernema carpocapsae TaxID=34508 RepID=A0A4U5PH40_STECR|nr:hypothetical protein L596_010031 [Steinernema carpocapsae]